MPSCLTGELGFVGSTLVVATGAGVLTVIAWGDLKPTDAYPASVTPAAAAPHARAVRCSRVPARNDELKRSPAALLTLEGRGRRRDRAGTSVAMGCRHPRAVVRGRAHLGI